MEMSSMAPSAADVAMLKVYLGPLAGSTVAAPAVTDDEKTVKASKIESADSSLTFFIFFPPLSVNLSSFLLIA